MASRTIRRSRSGFKVASASHPRGSPGAPSWRPTCGTATSSRSRCSLAPSCCRMGCPVGCPGDNSRARVRRGFTGRLSRSHIFRGGRSAGRIFGSGLRSASRRRLARRFVYMRRFPGGRACKLRRVASLAPPGCRPRAPETALPVPRNGYTRFLRSRTKTQTMIPVIKTPQTQFGFVSPRGSMRVRIDLALASQAPESRAAPPVEWNSSSPSVAQIGLQSPARVERSPNDLLRGS